MAIEISDKAVDEVRKMMTKEQVDAAGLRVGTSKVAAVPGCRITSALKLRTAPATKSIRTRWRQVVLRS